MEPVWKWTLGRWVAVSTLGCATSVASVLVLQVYGHALGAWKWLFVLLFAAGCVLSGYLYWNRNLFGQPLRKRRGRGHPPRDA